MSLTLTDTAPSFRVASAGSALRWLHRWTVLTACLTFVLLAIGAMVTTFQAGMADPIWPTYPWHLLLVPWQDADARFLIEHSHRLAGYIVGCCTIVLVIGLFRLERRRGVRLLGVAALMMVVIQGLIGGFRIRLNEIIGTDLAMTHGTFAAIVFSTLVSIAVLTSPYWRSASVNFSDTRRNSRVRVISKLVVALILFQIMLGSVLRHRYSTLGQRGHLLVAFGVVFGVAWLVQGVLSSGEAERGFRNTTLTLAVLISIQVFLGVEAWMLRYFVPSNLAVQALIRTTHVLVGYLSLATAVAVALRLQHSSTLISDHLAARGMEAVA